MKIPTSVLVGVVAALAVIGAYVLITHKVPGPWYSNPIASSTPEGAGRVEDWKTFRSDAYRFSFKYPAYYPDIKEAAAEEVIIWKYNSATKKKTELRIKPLAAWRSETDTKSANPGQSIMVRVFKDSDYGFADYAAGQAWSYDAAASAMWQGEVSATSTWKRISTALSGEGWKAYELGAGDAGEKVRTAAVPLRDRRIVLELDFGTGPEAKGEPPFNQALSTLKVK